MSVLAMKPLTFEESIAALKLKVTETGLDEFRVKVYRKASQASSVESIAVLDRARLEHLSTPEPWLVPLFGGGPIFVLTAFHAQDLDTAVATLVPPLINVPPLPEVNVSVIKSEHWSGPAVLTYANKIATKPVPPASAYFGGGPTGLESAPRAGQTDQSGGPAPVSFEAALAAIQRERAELQEQRHKSEIEEVRRQADASAKRLEGQIRDLVEVVKSRPAEPQKSLADSLAPLITAVMPVTTALIASQQADRKHREELEARREERAAVERADAAKRESAMQERLMGQGAELSKMISGFSEALGSISRSMVQTIASVQELAFANREAPDEGWYGLAKVGMQTLAEFIATRTAAPPPPAVIPQAISPPTAPATPPPQEPAAVEGAVPLDKATAEDVISEIEAMLRERAPPREVAEFYVEALQVNVAFRADLRSKGNVIGLFQARLGQEWLADQKNLAYVQEVLTAMNAVVKEHAAKPAA